MITHAQNFEDVILARAFRGVRDGFYVDIGACFPDVGSVTRHFYDLGWSGVNVEPMQAPFERLAQARPRDTNLRIAIDERDGELAVFEGPTVGESSALRRDAGALPVVVPCLTLASLCAQYCPRPIDFLKVDVEGLELRVISGGDWQRYRPRIVVVEVSEPWRTSLRPDASAIAAFLARHRYAHAYFDGLNAFYVAEEAADLAPLIAMPPNVLDGFSSPREVAFDEAAHALRATEAANESLTRDVATARQWGEEAVAQLTQRLEALDDQLRVAREWGRSQELRAGALDEQVRTTREWGHGHELRADALVNEMASTNRWATAAVGALEERLAAQHRQTTDAAARATRAEASFRKIERSRSWAITRPLRAAASLVRRAADAWRGARADNAAQLPARIARRAMRAGKRSPLYRHVAPVVRRHFPQAWTKARRLLAEAPGSAGSTATSAPLRSLPTLHPVPADTAGSPPPTDRGALTPESLAEQIKDHAYRQRS